MQIATIAGADKVDAGATELGRVFAGATWGWKSMVLREEGERRRGRGRGEEGEAVAAPCKCRYVFPFPGQLLYLGPLFQCAVCL